MMQASINCVNIHYGNIAHHNCQHSWLIVDKTTSFMSMFSLHCQLSAHEGLHVSLCSFPVYVILNLSGGIGWFTLCGVCNGG